MYWKNQIFFLSSTDLKDFPQHSKSPIVSSVLLPFLSFLPAIFHVFFGLLTSFLHLGHLAMNFTLKDHYVMYVDKNLSGTWADLYSTC